MTFWRSTAAFLLAGLTSCGAPKGGGVACGIASMAGPAMILDQFNVPGQTLGQAPRTAPRALPVRIAAATVHRGIVTVSDSGWLIGISDPIPPTPPVGFGVLVIDRTLGARGVMLYDGAPVRGAPVIGTVASTSASYPLLGLEVAFAEFDEDACPFFPDSLR